MALTILRQSRFSTVTVGLLSVIVLLAAGCGESNPVPSSAPGVGQPSESAQTPTASPNDANQAPSWQLVRETWDLALLGGMKIGHSHLQEFATMHGEQPVREVLSSTEMTMRRFGDPISQRIELSSVKSLDGQVLRFGAKMLGPSESTTISGEYHDGQMIIKTKTLGKTRTSSLNWDTQWGDYFADQQSLKREPMQPGGERTVIALFPGTTQVAEIKMKAMQRESVMLLDEQRELLRIESSLSLMGTTIHSILWADETGEVLKSVTPSMKQETYRTTKEIALRPNDEVGFDLGTQTVVRISEPSQSPHRATQIVYRARLANSSAAARFSNCRSQSVKKIDDHTAQITVRAIRPNSNEGPNGESGVPTEADTQPNNLIQSDDTAIISLAERFAEGLTDPWEIAKKFEVRVRDYVDSTTLSQAIASAADVVRSREGDCTEHAVLMAALCRAKGIPARVAIGLVYYAPAQGFAYHMWNEVWIADGWVPLDATLGYGGIGAGHLKIADSDLNSASPVTALLPVVEVLGQLELEIVSLE